jgi:hypothetical protein
MMKSLCYGAIFIVYMQPFQYITYLYIADSNPLFRWPRDSRVEGMPPLFVLCTQSEVAIPIIF